MKKAVRELRPRAVEAFIPLQHEPGEAQVDIGQALVRRGGALQKVYFFVMGLPYSGALYVQASERSCTETFWEFMRRAFEYLEGRGVPILICGHSVSGAAFIGKAGWRWWPRSPLRPA